MFVFMGILVISIGQMENKKVTFNCDLARVALFSYGKTKKGCTFFLFVYSSVRPSITLTGVTESGIHHTNFRIPDFPVKWCIYNLFGKYLGKSVII